MAVVQTGDNKWAVARYIVDPTAGQGTHTTIAAAMADAVSGDVIAVRQGTYTEGTITIPAGVTLTTMGGGEYGGVTIASKLSMTAAGTSTIFGMRLQTASDFAVAVTGTLASVLFVENCYINCTNNTGISFTSSSASSQLIINGCLGNVSTTGIAPFAHSSAGALFFYNSNIGNSGSTTTASTASAGTLNIQNSVFNSPVTTSGTNACTFAGAGLNCFNINTTALTAGGSGSQTFITGLYSGGTATAISCGSATPVFLGCVVTSTNAAAIAGAGTISYCNLTFSNSSAITTTTQVVLLTGPSTTIGSSNSGNTNTLTVTNSSNTASSSANIVSTVGGSTAADPTHQSVVSGVTTWTWGADNSVTSPTADPFVLAQGTALGTNNVMSVATSGEINYPLQPAFLAYQPSDATNATGDGTNYTLGTTVDLTEVYDQNSDFDPTSGVFTAPVTGRYLLGANMQLSGGTAITNYIAYLSSSNRLYQNNNISSAASAFTQRSAMISALMDMDAADTCTAIISATDTGGKIDEVSGAANPLTYIFGNLMC